MTAAEREHLRRQRREIRQLRRLLQRQHQAQQQQQEQLPELPANPLYVSGHDAEGTPLGHPWYNTPGFNPDWILHEPITRPDTCMLCRPPHLCMRHAETLARYNHHDTLRQQYFASHRQPARGQSVNPAGPQPEIIDLVGNSEEEE